MTIAAAEDWFVAVVKDVVGDKVSVITGPHDFDGSFPKHVFENLPAVVIVLNGGVAADSTSVTLDATWTLYVITGWDGGARASRRRSAVTGAYAISTALMVRLHRTNMGQRQFSAQGTGAAVPNIPAPDQLDGFGIVQLTKFVNEGAGEWERLEVAIYSVEFEQQMPLELPIDENLADWLRTHVDYDLPDVGEDVDLESDFDMPQ